MSGILYLIPTPIGNLSEVSPRIISTIKEVDFVACEDTRNTSKLLSLLGLSKTCVSPKSINIKGLVNLQKYSRRLIP